MQLLLQPIIAAYYLEAIYCVSECPQSNLYSYPQSSKFLKTLKIQPDEQYLDIFRFFQDKEINYEINIIFNCGDFYHINSSFDHYKKENENIIKKIQRLKINIFREYKEGSYNYGHVALSKDKAINLIKSIFD